MSETPDHAVILLADDRDDDVFLIRRSFLKANIINPLFVVRDGEEAMHYLAGEGKYSNRDEYPLPDLLLLDLKMPRMDGFEVLRWVREQAGLKALRVVVLTSSDEVRDVNAAYQLGANSFLVKPIDFEHFVKVSQALKGYWLWLNKTPEIFRPGSVHRKT
jgi:CheY-like chemotaxis protein